jgi:hypothetical protein
LSVDQHISKYAYGTQHTQRAIADVSQSTTQELVAAISGPSAKRIRVLSLAFVCGGTATTATFKSATTAISPVFQNAANGGAVLGHNPLGWFQTEAGEALNVTTGAGSTTGLIVVWIPI